MNDRRKNTELRDLIERALTGDDLDDLEIDIICKPEIMAKLCEIRNAEKLLNAIM